MTAKSSCPCCTCSVWSSCRRKNQQPGTSSSSLSQSSRRVLRVEPNVFIAKIASPERAAARAQGEVKPQADITVVLQVCRGGGGVERLRYAGVVEEHVAQPER